MEPLAKQRERFGNYLYLSQKLADTEDAASRETFSTRHWPHINLLGEYDLPEEKLQDTVGIKPTKLTTSTSQDLGGCTSSVSSAAFTSCEKSYESLRTLVGVLTRIIADTSWKGKTTPPAELEPLQASVYRDGAGEAFKLLSPGPEPVLHQNLQSYYDEVSAGVLQVAHAGYSPAQPSRRSVRTQRARDTTVPSDLASLRLFATHPQVERNSAINHRAIRFIALSPVELPVDRLHVHICEVQVLVPVVGRDVVPAGADMSGPGRAYCPDLIPPASAFRSCAAA